MKVIVTGASGFIGAHIVETLCSDHEVTGTFFSSTHGAGAHIRAPLLKLDITDRDSVSELFDEIKPDVIIHTAAMTSIADCESQPGAAARINVEGTSNIIGAAGGGGFQTRPYILLFSTDMVFDGTEAPYSENNPPKPLSIYGRTKSESEILCPPGSLVLRIALSFGRSINPGRATFFEQSLGKLARGEEAIFFHDEWRTPLWVGDLTRIISLLLEAEPSGIIHIGGPERISRLDMAIRACKTLGLDHSKTIPRSIDDMPGPQRPRDLSLETAKFREKFPRFAFTDFEQAIKLSKYEI